MTTGLASRVVFGPDGLVPAVVQDATDGRVLMVAWMDPEALAATLETGDVHFHSRSRKRLWRKGETSGNVLRSRGIELDCDGDALLVTAEATGPTCHTGTRSCFDAGQASIPDSGRAADPTAATPADDQGFAFLESLWDTIRARAVDPPPGSYTARLIEGGVDAVGRKVTEEATEVLLAARDDAEAQSAVRDRASTRAALAGEMADLLYHALVLLAERDVAPSAAIDILRSRHRA
ncbi:MAG: bifunctional phosphoribosyl-AMP cyclohydrolase/phosphoribosyl-ATP diphosphatase HisIE [Chloroflexota bacterium]